MASTSSAPAATSNTALSCVKILGDPAAKDDLRLKAALELTEHFETITHCPGYQTFLEQSMKIFLKILQDGEPHFISEYNIQQVSFCMVFNSICYCDCFLLAGAQIDS